MASIEEARAAAQITKQLPREGATRVRHRRSVSRVPVARYRLDASHRHVTRLGVGAVIHREDTTRPHAPSVLTTVGSSRTVASTIAAIVARCRQRVCSPGVHVRFVTDEELSVSLRLRHARTNSHHSRSPKVIRCCANGRVI